MQPILKKLSINYMMIRGRRVFMRVDFNVPIEGVRITDDTRIRETLPTVRLAATKGARIVLASHLGRPQGKPDHKYSLRPVAQKLAKLLGRPVVFALDCIGPDAEAKSKALPEGGVLLLQNVRFHKQEEANDEGFARKLAALCDGMYVCDAFGSAHRAHASVVGITKFVHQAGAGLLMEKELRYLGMALQEPRRPFIAVLGGAKVSDKIEVIQNLMKIADGMLIGGAMAYTFLKAQGFPVGSSLVEDDKLDLARQILADAKAKNFRLLLPLDHVLGKDLKAPGPTEVCEISATPPGWMGLDIGPQTTLIFSAELARARMVVWNGPMGVFENPAFARGTLAIAQAVADSTGKGAISIIGGGDSVAAVHQSGLADRISHISTGGGASLEFLAGRKLPGVEALTDA
jgi:phosphoglycerate kinase